MASLYERLGGDSSVKLSILHFFEQIEDDPKLQPFFENISTGALQVHQLKLFKVIFGPEEGKPEQGEFFDFMLATHTRLFRELGLNEEHFDIVATCFVRALENLLVEQPLIDECLAVLGPLRDVFALGARVASEEKEYDAKKLKKLPKTTSKNIEDHSPSVLPDPAQVDIPDWLPKTLGHHSDNGVVRAWTCELIDKFGDGGDPVIADVFMDMPYMNHHVYCAALLQLAFLPKDVNSDDLLPIVKFPNGPDKERLSVAVWNRMIVEFGKTCASMNMDQGVTEAAVGKLKSYKPHFPNSEVKPVGGLSNPHVLGFKAKVKGRTLLHENESLTGSESCCDDKDSSVKEMPYSKPRSRRVWQRLIGWSKRSG